MGSSLLNLHISHTLFDFGDILTFSPFPFHGYKIGVYLLPLRITIIRNHIITETDFNTLHFLIDTQNTSSKF
ncbi:hypothetical protein X975_02346, partial [Stegodyphus mimosarum]